MAYKDKAQEIKYKNDYTRDNYDILKATASKEDGQTIRRAAAAAGQSVSAYILQAIRERMARDSKAGGG